MAAIRETDPSLRLHLIAGTPGPLLEEAARLGAVAEVLPMPEALTRLGDSSLRSGRSFSKRLFRLADAPAGMPALRRYRRLLKQRVAAIAPTIIHSNGIKTHLLTRSLD